MLLFFLICLCLLLIDFYVFCFKDIFVVLRRLKASLG